MISRKFFSFFNLFQRTFSVFVGFKSSLLFLFSIDFKSFFFGFMAEYEVRLYLLELLNIMR